MQKLAVLRQVITGDQVRVQSALDAEYRGAIMARFIDAAAEFTEEVGIRPNRVAVSPGHVEAALADELSVELDDPDLGPVKLRTLIDQGEVEIGGMIVTVRHLIHGKGFEVYNTGKLFREKVEVKDG